MMPMMLALCDINRLVKGVRGWGGVWRARALPPGRSPLIIKPFHKLLRAGSYSPRHTSAKLPRKARLAFTRSFEA